MKIIERKHFSVAIIDQANTMFIANDENVLKFVYKIPEHLSRIVEFSENQHILMDYTAFEALDQNTLPNRFCRIFCRTQEQIDKVKISSSYRVHHVSEIHKIMHNSALYSPKTIMFFIGGKDFLNSTFQYSRKLLLTVIDCIIDSEDKKTEKFDISTAKAYFTKRKDIIPEMMIPIAEYKAIKNKTKKENNIEIADNGMRIIKTTEIVDQQLHDAIFDTPNYMFYEFTK